jgi:hypothetical protein
MKKMKKVVRFDTIEIREYPLAIGSHGIPKSGGVPIGITGWHGERQEIIPLNRYEHSKRCHAVLVQQQQQQSHQHHPNPNTNESDIKPPRGGGGGGRRRHDMILSSQDRTKV